MTSALIVYSGVFMRYAFAVSPVNYLLFGCHAVNFSAQNVQMYRYLNYWKCVYPLCLKPWTERNAILARGLECQPWF